MESFIFLLALGVLFFSEQCLAVINNPTSW
jgi:hypothetical protein